ncbi:MAG: tetratricopeptide repeat protein [Usitatibacter sp.]
MSAAPPVRRNDPCPCGSGLRYKACHGKPDAGAPSTDALVQRALQLHQRGQVDEAARLYDEVLSLDPGNAIATHYLGMVAWHRGDLALAERLMRESIAANATIADFNNNLGLLLRDTGRHDEAIACYRRTLEVDPGWFAAYNNMGLALESSGHWDQACESYRAAIVREPRFAAARQNLARALLATGHFREAWEQYRWRLVAQGATIQMPGASDPQLEDSLNGREVLLRSEQGIGDVLFFLRFAPELVRRGARLAFQGDTRLHRLLERTGLFELGFSSEYVATPGRESFFVGDLPWLLDAHDPDSFPPPLRLTPQQERVHRLEERFPANRGTPLVGLTWRAGTVAPGPIARQLKEVAPAELARAARGRQATWISVQRQPRAGEREALEQELGATVHDASGANEDLEEMLALMSVLDDYVGVSNFNTHLRAGLGRPMETLVPFPPEWRWGTAGERSAWFPTARIARLHSGGPIGKV